MEILYVSNYAELCCTSLSIYKICCRSLKIKLKVSNHLSLPKKFSFISTEIACQGKQEGTTKKKNKKVSKRNSCFQRLSQVALNWQTTILYKPEENIKAH